MTKQSKKSTEESKNKIISLLKIKSNISDYAISKEMHCSRQKVWRIRKDLEEDHIIWGYSIVIDQEKMGRKEFILLLKRSEEIIDEKCVNSLLFEELSEYIDQDNINIESIICVYGIFDLVLVLNAPDIISVKSFVTNFKKSFGTYFKQIVLLENIEILKKNWIKNPDAVDDRKKLLRIL